MPSFGFLQKLFLPVLRILGMSVPPNTDEFPQNVSVVDWGRVLVERYTSSNLKSPENSARMRRLQVLRIHQYKELESPGHEYLVAEIAVPESEKRYIRLDRSAEDLDPEESSSAKMAISNGSSQSLLAISSNPAASDMVKTIAGWPSETCIGKLDCENLPEPITLLDFALAAEVVHNDSEKYKLLSRQCYWYADTVSAVLETYFPQIKKIKIKIQYTKNGEDERHDKKSGKFMKIHVHKREQADVDRIVENFRERKATVTALVCFSDLCNVF